MNIDWFIRPRRQIRLLVGHPFLWSIGSLRLLLVTILMCFIFLGRALLHVNLRKIRDFENGNIILLVISFVVFFFIEAYRSCTFNPLRNFTRRPKRYILTHYFTFFISLFLIFGGIELSKHIEVDRIKHADRVSGAGVTVLFEADAKKDDDQSKPAANKTQAADQNVIVVTTESYFDEYRTWYRLLRDKGISDSSSVADLEDFRSFVIDRATALKKAYYTSGLTISDYYSSKWAYDSARISNGPPNPRVAVLLALRHLRDTMPDIFTLYPSLKDVQESIKADHLMTTNITFPIGIVFFIMTVCMMIFQLRLFPARMVTAFTVIGFALSFLTVWGVNSVASISGDDADLGEPGAQVHLLFAIVFLTLIYLLLHLLSPLRLFLLRMRVFFPVGAALCLIYYLGLNLGLSNSDDYNVVWDILLFVLTILVLPAHYYSLYRYYIRPEKYN